MEEVRYEQLPEMLGAEAGRNFESRVKADFKVLGLRNWKGGVAIY